MNRNKKRLPNNLYRQFSSRDWVYGATFPFDFSCTEKFPWGEVSIRLRVEQGICRQAAVYTDAMDAHLFDVLTRKLEGCAFSGAALCGAVESADLPADVAGDLCGLIRSQNL